MKIKHIEAIPLVRGLREPFHGGTYYISSRNTIVTRVELEGGVVGHDLRTVEMKMRTTSKFAR